MELWLRVCVTFLLALKERARFGDHAREHRLGQLRLLEEEAVADELPAKE